MAAGKKIQNSTGLTGNQIRFCEEYLIDYSGAEAAIRAGYSKKSAKFMASRLLTKAKINDYLSEKQKELSNKLNISSEKALREIARIAFCDIRRVFNSDGTVKHIKDMDTDTAAAISSFEVEMNTVGSGKKKVTNRIVKLKFWDKNKALEMLAKHFKIYSDAPINPLNITAKKIVFK